MGTARILLFILIFTKLSPAYCQQPDNVVSKLEFIRDELAELNCDCEAEIDSSVVLINKGLANLSMHPVQISKKYKASIDGITALAKGIKNRPAQESKQMLRDLLKDLKAKFKDEKHYAENQSLFRLVEVKVLTKNATSEISNLAVHYSLLGYAVDYNHPSNTFLNLTSPAVADLVPGLYHMWVTKPNNTTVLSERKVEVDPAKKTNIIFYVDTP